MVASGAAAGAADLEVLAFRGAAFRGAAFRGAAFFADTVSTTCLATFLAAFTTLFSAFATVLVDLPATFLVAFRATLVAFRATFLVALPATFLVAFRATFLAAFRATFLAARRGAFPAFFAFFAFGAFADFEDFLGLFDAPPDFRFVAMVEDGTRTQTEKNRDFHFSDSVNATNAPFVIVRTPMLMALFAASLTYPTVLWTLAFGFVILYWFLIAGGAMEVANLPPEGGGQASQPTQESAEKRQKTAEAVLSGLPGTPLASNVIAAVPTASEASIPWWTWALRSLFQGVGLTIIVVLNFWGCYFAIKFVGPVETSQATLLMIAIFLASLPLALLLSLPLQPLFRSAGRPGSGQG